MFRYELFWLPLVAQSPNVPAAAPLDIAWVWHVHILSPLSYERDCNEIVSTFVDHKVLVGIRQIWAREHWRRLWSELYDNEPFDVDLSAPASNVPHVSRIQYGIVSACSRQRVFYYQVSLPHYGDEKFLTKALERYKQHLKFVQQHPNKFLVPCFDSDLIWHAHQAHPLAYRTDTIKLLGKVLNHDDSANDRRAGSKRSTSAQTTEQLWSAANMEYERRGTMFRGEPPFSIGENDKLVDYSSMRVNEYTVDVIKIEIGISASKCYKVKIDVKENIDGKAIEKRFKGPATEIYKPSGVPLSKFVFRTEINNFFQVR